MKAWLRKRKVEDREEGHARLAVAVLIMAPAGVTLVRDPSKGRFVYWKFPGGKGKSGETPEEAAVREVFEETGIRLDPGELVLLHEEDRGMHDSFVFSVTLSENPSVNEIGDEGEEVRVFPMEDFWGIENLLPFHQKILRFYPDCCNVPV